ncbi:MAG: hypothetical protein J6K96_02810 [Treponema sp.]|nr:hypothetical protein [Treponema sp.]
MDNNRSTFSEPELFSEENLIDEHIASGFCLEKFQLLNWGVFNKQVYTLEAGNKSALLTGQNGSGKTTLVDAIVTLLVPNQMRFYNQSSGSTKKKDRSEESYVRGAFGNKQAEDSIYSRTEYLRDTDTFSILNGVFCNQRMQSYVSLLQIRYFSGSSLVRIFAITKQNLSIEAIYDFLKSNGTSINRENKWKRLLEKNFGTIFFGDNFKKYSEAFSQIFGLRSEKALKLFSQIVGLKVLGNLTEFISQNMLEQTGTDEEFQKLQENYTKLIQCDNEIQKTKIIIELLEKVVSTGIKLREAENKRNENELFSTVLPAWRAKNAILLLETEIKNLSNKIWEENQNLSESKAEHEKLQNEIDDLTVALANNDVANRIRSLDSEISNKEEEKSRCQNRSENYKAKAEIIGFELPATENQFNRNKEKLASVSEQLDSEKNALEEKKFGLQKNLEEKEQEAQKIKDELASLGERNSNIPFENIQIRKKICAALKIEESELPFAGELIQVKREEEKWTFALERLLHNFALTILVSEKLYKRVTNYVKENNVGGRLVYLKTENQIFQKTEKADSEKVPYKLDIKKNHALAEWIFNYLSEHFDFLCTDDIERITKAEKALTSRGLVKNRLRHEKDDRKKITENFNQVLGWDNTQKRKSLSGKFDFVSTEIKTASLDFEEIKKSIEKKQNQIAVCNSLEEFILWTEIDFASVAKHIDKLRTEREKLAASKEVKELQEKLDSKKLQRSNLDSKIEDLNKNLGRNQDNSERLRGEKNQHETVWQNYLESKEFSDSSEYDILLLDKKFNLAPFGSLNQLEEKHKELSETIKRNSVQFGKTISELNTVLVKQMGAVLNPKADVREKFGDWSSQFTDFEANYEYLSDFESLYKKLSKDDLPKYRNQFHTYLHETINEDIIDFNEHIGNSCQQIKIAIDNLNKSLREIAYEHNPDTYLQLVINPSSDQRIKEFRNKLKNAIPDHIQLQRNSEEYEEKLFKQIYEFLNMLQSNQTLKEFVLDVRNWFNFAAKENFCQNDAQKQFYNDSASLSGGEKAKLTYTILASAIAYQFGIDRKNSSSFRFVIIDEAFSKSDAANSNTQ